jgi:hypothetical protein
VGGTCGTHERKGTCTGFDGKAQQITKCVYKGTSVHSDIWGGGKLLIRFIMSVSLTPSFK